MINLSSVKAKTSMWKTEEQIQFGLYNLFVFLPNPRADSEIVMPKWDP